MSDDKKNQHDRFTETARRLGADDDEAAFKGKLAVIARQKPNSDAFPPSSRTPKKGRP